jgi:hypothetical protein
MNNLSVREAVKIWFSSHYDTPIEEHIRDIDLLIQELEEGRKMEEELRRTRKN